VRGKEKIPEDRRKMPRIEFHLPVAIGGKKGLKEIRNFGVVGVRIRARVIHVSKEGIGVELLDVIPQDIMALERCFSIFKHTIPMPGK
jgi:hypothetical protein